MVFKLFIYVFITTSTITPCGVLFVIYNAIYSVLTYMFLRHTHLYLVILSILYYKQ